jgi:hypothetical protein
VALSNGREGKLPESGRTTGYIVAPLGGANLNSVAISSGTPKKLFQLTVKRIGSTTKEQVTELLKVKVNATGINVGINKSNVLNNGNVII